MIDKFNRKIDYIRISVTDRCNLRCIYCMPAKGIELLNHEDILNYDEIVRLCRCLVPLGIHKVKLTGGEPLIRKNLSVLLQMLHEIEGIDSITLTTNGLLLKEQLSELVQAGLNGVNISLHSLNPKIYERITGYNALGTVLDSIKEALTYDHLNVKINCVPIPGINDEDILGIAEMAKDTRLSVRFIEMMPIGLGRDYNHYSEDAIVNTLQIKYGSLEKTKESLGNGPAHYYQIPGFMGRVGFISAISHQFCDQCNRIRLTSDGFIKTCLQYSDGVDCKALLRGSMEDEQIKHIIFDTIQSKPSSHNFNDLRDQKNIDTNDSIKTPEESAQITYSGKKPIYDDAKYEQKQMHKIGG